ncbi:MAG: hypothetical protein A2Y10_08500 [Planctomycetes bacterium GWF2_41_51]|nr:MAG: hypothetical protein A2Y10_08500 [Planctomycetes bacterium GWF2_41_51]HBG27077.1 hypothetical protein [Phycisphaerales bacterium]
MKLLSLLTLISLLLPITVQGDTIINTATSETYHGYLTGKESTGLVDVNTTEKGLIKVNKSHLKITRDSAGRNNCFALFEIEGSIMAGMETTALEEALQKAASQGPLFILLEIDSPGGRVDLCKRMCAAIQQVGNCDVYAYIKGGESGGAYSAAAVVSMACDKIYMAPGTVIGAATMISTDANGKPIDMKTALGETVGEKMSSAWRNYMASLASSKNRPAALAVAMENKDIEVIEVNDGGKRVFIDSSEKKPDCQIVKVWSKKGELLTLPAKDAIACGMADKIYLSRQDLLEDHNAATAQVITDDSIAKAKELYEKIDKRIDELMVSIDLGVKRFETTRSRVQAMKALKSLIYDAKFALSMKKRFGNDVRINEDEVQDFLNDAQAVYDSIRTARR